MNKHHVILNDGSVHTRNSQNRVYDYAITREGMRVRDAKGLVSHQIRTTDKALTKMMKAVSILESDTPLNREMNRDSWHDGKDYVSFSVGEGDDNVYLKVVTVEDLAFEGDAEVEQRVREAGTLDCKQRRNFYLSLKQQDCVLLEML